MHCIGTQSIILAAIVRYRPIRRIQHYVYRAV